MKAIALALLMLWIAMPVMADEVPTENGDRVQSEADTPSAEPAKPDPKAPWEGDANGNTYTGDCQGKCEPGTNEAHQYDIDNGALEGLPDPAIRDQAPAPSNANRGRGNDSGGSRSNGGGGDR